MLIRETASYIPRGFSRSLAPQIVKLPGTDRLPRYRVQRSQMNMDSLVGTIILGRYYVLSQVGTGGMSVVYKVRSLRRSRPKVLAVKTLRTQGLGDETVIKRFQREAELLSHLNHPRIVQVFDYGYTKRGQPFFVMDYLVGRNLGQVITQEGPVSADRVRYIFNQVCGAVDHAHRCGVIHRDLKPGNIMLLDLDGERDFVKVVDFGIARFQHETNRLTRLGEVWGSPVYMSPEQCMGKPLDIRSDVYSLGIAMYEALTGEVPFLGKSYVETMSQQINEPPKSFAEVCPTVTIPESLEAVVFRALSKDPIERHQTVAELRGEIEEAFTNRSYLRTTNQRITRQRVEAAQRSASKRTAALKSRDLASKVRSAAILVLLVLLLVAGYLVAMHYLGHHDEPVVSGSEKGQLDTGSGANPPPGDRSLLRRALEEVPAPGEIKPEKFSPKDKIK